MAKRSSTKRADQATIRKLEVRILQLEGSNRQLAANASQAERNLATTQEQLRIADAKTQRLDGELKGVYSALETIMEKVLER